MTVKLGVVMDPIHQIHYKKDTTLAMLLEAKKRGWSLFYFEQSDLFVRDGVAWGKSRSLTVAENPDRWFEFVGEEVMPLENLDVILMRKDPPFDIEYIYTTYILEFAKAKGVPVVNDPQALRDANEKLFAQWFPACMPPTLVAREHSLLRSFVEEHGDVVLKPLDSMGGGSIFRLKKDDNNINVAIEVLTQQAQRHIMAQQFLPAIYEGDKRIFLIDGEPLPYALARLPLKGEIRGNLAAGGQGKGVPLSPRDYWICDQIKDVLREKGLLFVGIDVIGEYLTEMNVTSPTCVRELQSFYDINIAALFLDKIEKKFFS